MEPEKEDYSEDRPTPPGGTAVEDGELQDPKVVEGAGMGSAVAYGTRGVVELGGTLGLDIRDETIDFIVAPTVGYFIADRVELSLIPLIRVQQVGDADSDLDETNVRFAAILEGSYHLPLSEVFYAFAGLGLGLTYEEGPGADFLIRPVIGMDIMIGRSGILKPTGFIDIGVGEGALGGGFLAGYTVMF